MFGLGTTISKAAVYSAAAIRGVAGYVRDNLKLYMPYKFADEVKFVGTGSTSFDGDDKITIGTGFNTILGSSFSVSMWIKSDNIGNDNRYRGLLTSTTTGGSAQWALYWNEDADNQLKFRYQLGGSGRTLTITPLIFSSINTWAHIVLTRQVDVGITFYLNGVESFSSTTQPGTMTTITDVMQFGDYNDEFEGSMKNCGIWDRPLTATEAQNVMYKTYGQLAGTEKTGLQGWWALDAEVGSDGNAGSGYILDEVSGAGSATNIGTITGATVDTDLYGGDTPKIPRAVDNAPTARADTIGNGSASFTASNTDYIATSATFQTTLDGAFTVTAWIKLNDGQPSAAQIICGSSSTSDEDRFYFIVDTTGKIEVLYKSNAGAGELSDLSTSAVFADGATDWTHVALTLTESGGTVTGTVYVNGVVEPGSFSGSGVMANFVTTYNLFIGAANRNTSGAVSPFDGNIAQVGIWSAVLTQAQIQEVKEKSFAELSASDKTNLVSYWTLDEQSGDNGVLDKMDETLGSEKFTAFDNASTNSFDTFSASSTGFTAGADDSGAGAIVTNQLWTAEGGNVAKISFDIVINSGSNAKLYWASATTGGSGVGTIIKTGISTGSYTLYAIVGDGDGTPDNADYLEFYKTSSHLTNITVSNFSVKIQSGNVGILK